MFAWRGLAKSSLARISQISDALCAQTTPASAPAKIPAAALFTRKCGIALRFGLGRGYDGFRGGPTVTRNNVLYLIIGALSVAVAVLGYQLYQDRHQPEGLHINVGPGGLSIEGK